MAIFIGEFGDKYASQLAGEYRKMTDSPIELYDFCVKDFRKFPNERPEYKIRLVDKHCGLKDTSKCKVNCPNPDKLGSNIQNEDVFFVLRGKYGNDWDSDKLMNYARQAAEILKSGSPEYFGGKSAKRLYGVFPHMWNTKQDHIFIEEPEDGEPFYIEGEPITVRMDRRTLKNAGYDYIFTVFPHDYRREGWVRKVARKGQLDKYVTDWRKIHVRERVSLENWTNFLWAIDPTKLITDYIENSELHPDEVLGPDYSAGGLVIDINRALGMWPESYDLEDAKSNLIEKRRSKGNSSILKAKRTFSPEIVKDKRVLFADDWALTLNTMTKGMIKADEYGAREIHGLIVHGQFIGDAYEDAKTMKFKNASGPFWHFTDTVNHPDAQIKTAPLVAKRMKYVIEHHYDGV